MNDVPPTRQSLLLELGRQSDWAWSEFLAVYEDALYRFCRSRGLQDADARDAVQDVLAALLQRLPAWDPDPGRGSFRGWLFRAARNIAVDELVRRTREALGSGDTRIGQVLREVPVGEASQAFDDEYQRALVQWASARVREEVRETTWRAFVLTAVEGRSAKDAALLLGIPAGRVYTAKCRVLARIRTRIDDLESAAEPPA